MALALRFYDRAETLPPGPKKDLLALNPYLCEDLEAALGVMRTLGLHEQIDLGEPIETICIKMEELLQGEAHDEARVAALRVVEATKYILLTLGAASNEASQLTAFLCGLALGQAEVRIVNVGSGVWDMLMRAEYTDLVSAQIEASRKAGGKTRGLEVSQKAQAWKAEALEIAQRIDKPTWSRTKLATEISWKAKGEIPGIKSLENWLKDEAEMPNGPIRSRRKPA